MGNLFGHDRYLIKGFSHKESLNIHLSRAAARGDDYEVEKLINIGADLEYRDRLGLTPLMLASISGYVSVCKCLLEHGCDIEARTKKTYETALTLAYKSDKKEIVTLLAQAKAHMEQQNERASDPSDMDDDLYEYNEDYDSNQDRTCQPSGIIHENSNVQNTSHQEFAFAQLHKMLQKFWLFVELYGTSNNDKDLNRHVYFMMLMLIIVVLGPVCLVQISLDKGELSIKEVQINQKDFQIQNLTQRLNHSSIKIKLLNKQLVSLEENRKLDATYMSRLIFGLANCIKSSRCNNSAVRQKNWIWMMNSNHDEVTEIYESKDFYTNSLNIFTNYTQPEFLVVEMLQPAFNEVYDTRKSHHICNMLTAYSIFLTMAAVPYLFMGIPRWKCDYRRDQLILLDSNNASIFVDSIQNAINSGNLTQNTRNALYSRLDEIRDIVINANQTDFESAHDEISSILKSIIRELEKEDRISLAKIKFENHWGSIKDYFNCQWFMDTLKNENKTKPLKWKSEQDKTFNQEANKTRPSKWSSTEEKAKLLKDTQTSEFRKKA